MLLMSNWAAEGCRLSNTVHILAIVFYGQAPPSKLELHNISHLRSLYWAPIAGRLSLPDDLLNVNLIWLQHPINDAVLDSLIGVKVLWSADCLLYFLWFMISVFPK